MVFGLAIIISSWNTEEVYSLVYHHIKYDIVRVSFHNLHYGIYRVVDSHPVAQDRLF